MNRPGLLYFSTKALAFLILSLAGFASADAAVPFTSATVTRLENDVSLGERHGDHSTTRAASVNDTIRANNFLLTHGESRAELQYPDNSVVRVGQNTVFTFDADTRTLSLEKGSLLFHIPKGVGGGTIKTPSLTAAITGTAGKVSTNIIAIVEGVVKLIPSGRLVHAGEFARANADGTITIAFFDLDKLLDGKLVFFHGIMPGFERSLRIHHLTLPDDHFFQVLEETQNLPGSINHFFPQHEPPSPVDRNTKKIFVPPPVNTPPMNNPPAGGHHGKPGGY